VGPTMLLKLLLVQNRHSLHDFLGGVGTQDHSLILTVDSNWFLGGKEFESKQRRGSYHNHHAGNPNLKQPLQQAQVKLISIIQLSD
jgi:hypothetical protein